MPEQTNQRTPEPLAEIAEAARAECLGARESLPPRSTVRSRALAFGILRAWSAGFLLAAFFPTLIILAAWVTSGWGWLTGTIDLDTPLGRDPVRWRVEKYLWYFPLEVCPLGFAAGLFARGAVEIDRGRAGPHSRTSLRARTLVGFLIAVYLLSASVMWFAAIPERPSEGGIPIRHDPIEDDPHLRPVFRAADQEAYEVWKGDPPRLGIIHGYWGTKKRILREKYGIEWRSPAELNPNVKFD